MEGFTKRIPVHLSRGPAESADLGLHGFYERLLRCWTIPSCRANGNCWNVRRRGTGTGPGTASSVLPGDLQDELPRSLVVVNYSPNQSQCYLRLPFDEMRDKAMRLRDVMGSQAYDRSGDDLLSHGLYLDLPAWGYHVFELSAD